MHQGKPETYARGLAFTPLIVANLALIWTNRSWNNTIVQTFRSRNVALWIVTAGALVLLGLVLNVPFLSELLRIARLDQRDIALCGLAGFASIAWFEVLKLFVKHSQAHA
jgi:P-type Ca2+ transporter type 2C